MDFWPKGLGWQVDEIELKKFKKFKYMFLFPLMIRLNSFLEIYLFLIASINDLVVLTFYLFLGSRIWKNTLLFSCVFFQDLPQIGQLVPIQVCWLGCSANMMSLSMFFFTLASHLCELILYYKFFYPRLGNYA